MKTPDYLLIMLLITSSLMLGCRSGPFQFEPRSQKECSLNLKAVVIAVSGLRLRTAPSIKAKKKSKVAYGARVQICRYSKRATKAGDLVGPWARVFVRGRRGWVFSAYLSVLGPVDGKLRRKIRKRILYTNSLEKQLFKRKHSSRKSCYKFYRRGYMKSIARRFSAYSCEQNGELQPGDSASEIITKIRVLDVGEFSARACVSIRKYKDAFTKGVPVHVNGKQLWILTLDNNKWKTAEVYDVKKCST